MNAVVTQDQLDELRAEVERLSSERDKFRHLYLQMVEAYKKLERGLMGQKAERLPPNEAQLAFDILSGLLQQRDRSTTPGRRGVSPCGSIPSANW